MHLRQANPLEGPRPFYCGHQFTLGFDVSKQDLDLRRLHSLKFLWLKYCL
jgi:hypothetical protein